MFSDMQQISLTGMNIGLGGKIHKSGETTSINYIAKKLNTEELIIFDVGANIGQYSLLLLDYFGSNCKIYSIEPSLVTYNELVRNTQQFNNIQVCNIAFGNKNEKAKLYSNKEKSGLSSIYKRRLDHFGIDFDVEEQIDIIKLDDFCQKEHISHIHFLKLDVEGNEYFVLEGGQNLISSDNIDFIQFEFGGCNIDSRTFFQDFFYLLHDKYRIYRILQDGIFEIKEYKEIYEVFITTNFLAERKL